jgi:hypothetical protein
LKMVLRLRGVFERFGRMLSPAFAGVIVVEAQKRLYQGLPVAVKASRRVFVPVLSPQGVPTTRTGQQAHRADTALDKIGVPR